MAETTRSVSASLRLGKAVEMKRIDASRFGFGQASPELRNIIYRYLLTTAHGEAICINNAAQLRRDGQPRLIAGLAILRTCKAVHKEAIGILYGMNTFRIDVLSFATPWCEGWDPIEFPFGLPHKSSLDRDLYHPGLSMMLKCMLTRHLDLMRTLQYAYHAEAPYTYADARQADLVHEWPMAAVLTVQVQLSARAPFFELAFVDESSSEKRQDVIDSLLEHLEHDLRSEFAVGGGGQWSALSVKRVKELAYAVRKQCDDATAWMQLEKPHLPGMLRALRQRDPLQYDQLLKKDEEDDADDDGAVVDEEKDAAYGSRKRGRARVSTARRGRAASASTTSTKKARRSMKRSAPKG